jgi:hypothetical protein
MLPATARARLEAPAVYALVAGPVPVGQDPIQPPRPATQPADRANDDLGAGGCQPLDEPLGQGWDAGVARGQQVGEPLEEPDQDGALLGSGRQIGDHATNRHGR